MISYGLAFYLIGMIAFIFHQGNNILMMIISIELILLSVGIILVNLSFHLDDLIGSHLTLYLLPLAGAESAVALAILVAFYPLRGSFYFLINLTCSLSFN